MIGLGRIGHTMAQLASVLGMNVEGWNRTPRPFDWCVGDLDEALAGPTLSRSISH